MEQLDLEVAEGVRAAEQRVPLLLLVIGEREGRIALQVDLALDDERLAGRALTLLASVHEHYALPEGGLEDRFVLVGLNLEPYWLEPDGMSLGHPSQPRIRLGPHPAGPPPVGGPAGAPELRGPPSPRPARSGRR